MITTHPARRRTAIALLAASALALAGCSTDNDPAREAAAPPASLETYGLAGLDAPQIIDKLDTMPVADRPDDLIASVHPTELTLTSGDENLATLPTQEDQFYLSVAPYENRTHSCHFHSLTTCLGEMAGEQVHVTVTNTTTGQTLIDEPRTTYDNGFLGLWLPRDINATLTIDHDGETATSPIATGNQDLTCLTTMNLT